MHIEYLYYFRDFSKSLSISKTAAEYYMTPQGLSRALHQLEKDFGITLMAYNNNAVTLTPAGKELAERVEGIIAQYDDARGALTKYKLSEIVPSQGIVRVRSLPACRAICSRCSAYNSQAYSPLR